MIRDQIRIWGTVFAALLGLAFGSFLNVCLSRWPEGESVVHPRSHCRTCGRILAWWENVPLVSWLALRGRCRGCGAWIGWRYVIVEAAVGTCWTIAWIRDVNVGLSEESLPTIYALLAIRLALLSYLLVGLAVLDAEHLWLPDVVTLPGIGIGLVFSPFVEQYQFKFDEPRRPLHALWTAIIAALAAAVLILIIRWLYWLIRRREGLGLGDAKLMALLGAWLGLPGALLAFGLGVILGALLALLVLLVPRHPLQRERWAVLKLPLGTFLCIGGIISALWGQQIIAAYLRWAGL